MIYVTHDQIEALTLADRIAIMKNGIIQQLDDPTTIYNSPRNLFVAGFIGSPSMNFLQGELAAVQGGTVFVANGVEFSLEGYRAAQPLRPGTRVVLGLRPEHVKVDEGFPAGAEVHEAIVDIEEPMGADNLLWLKHAGHIMSVRVNGSRRFKPGTAVKLVFDMSVASIFDKETELRL
jgi:multiple sugar transport system ATP-binding protein